MSDTPFLSIIIPAYNEERRIGTTLIALASYFAREKYSYEIIVVDDGSTDGTCAVVSKHISKFVSLRILRNKANCGKGFSVKRGMTEARGELRLFLDADNSVKIENLHSFIAHIKKGSDIVIASIEVPGAQIQITDDNPVYRRGLGTLAKVLIRKIATPGIYDTQRGFKLFTQAAANLVFGRQTIDRWGFDIELIVIAQRHLLQIDELPVSWDNPKGGTVAFASYLRTLVDLWKIKLNLWKGVYDPAR